MSEVVSGDAMPQDGGASEEDNEIPEVYEGTGIGFVQPGWHLHGQTIVSKSWPSDHLPAPTSSLLAVASKKGIFAAATPDGLIINTTEKTRRQYMKTREQRGTTLTIEPELTLPLPRLSHVAFSADESWLVVASEQGGGLAVYETAVLSSGAQPKHQISTNSTSIRHLIPNPSSQDENIKSLFIVILTDGALLVANIVLGQLIVNKQSTNVFQQNVSCAAWAKMGKQMVVGFTDGTAARVTIDGEVAETIPRPPEAKWQEMQAEWEGAQSAPLSSIVWLRSKGTMVFLLVYTPVYPQGTDPEAVNQESEYYIAAHPKGEPWTFRKVPALVDSMGHTRRTPSSQFILRLNDWLQLEDMLIVMASASTEVGILTDFREPQGEDVPAGYAKYTPEELRKVTIVYGLDGTTPFSPTGSALDLGATEVVPYPTQDAKEVEPEISHSHIPQPAVYILGVDGTLTIKWLIYNEAIYNKAFAPGMVHRSGQYATIATIDGVEQEHTESLAGTSPVDSSRSGQNFFSGSQPLQNSTFLSMRPTPAASKPSTPAPGGNAFGNVGQMGQSKNLWGSSTPAPAFGKTTAPQAFGNASPMGAKPSPFGQQSKLPVPASGSGLSPFSGFASQPSAFGQVSQSGAKASPFGGIPALKPGAPSPFANAGQSSATSPFASVGQPSESKGSGSPKQNETSASPFLQKDSSNLSNFSNLSTQTSGSTVSGFGSGGFGSGSAFAKSSFGSTSRESTANEDLAKTEKSIAQSSGLGGLGGFKLGSTFTGDGTAKDDLPKPKNPGAGFFGDAFGQSLGSSTKEQSSPIIKSEPGAEKQPSLKDIPAAKPSPVTKSADAPLPPDPMTYKPPKGWNDGVPGINDQNSTNDAPLPPDPATYKPPAGWNAPLPGAGEPEKDVPIAGSPPINVTNSQTFGDAYSEIAGPSEDGSEEWNEEDDDEEIEEGDAEGEEGEEGDEVSEEEEEDDESDEDEEEADEEVPYQPQDPAGLAAFKARMQPADPKSPDPPRAKTESRTPQSDEKSMKSSYTPAGLPKGPVFQPPANRPQHSPRSPSPQRAVTSPVRGRNSNPNLPSTIKTHAVPPPKPVQRPAPAPKPREPTAGELADQQADEVERFLQQPIEPSIDAPYFHTHTDYTGTVDTPGLGGQIEKVYRDINSMVHTVGLNARSLHSYVAGHQQLRKPGPRVREDLENQDDWLLGDIADLETIMADINRQLDEGKLECVQDKLKLISEEQKEVRKIEVKANALRKQVRAHIDPDHRAAQDAAPLDAETKAQQSDLREGVRSVQKLLADIEQKMTMLRADLASVSHQTNGGQSNTAVPTVEAVMNTIQRMTAAVQQKSADVDFLEAQIKRLPQGIESLRLGEDYEDDLVSRLGSNRLLADRGSPTATPPRRARMAANGDPLGMSGMFGLSRFRTPPSASLRRSQNGTSALGRSAGSMSGSARKKMIDVTEEDVEIYRAGQQRRANVVAALKKRIETNGPRTIRP